MNKNVQSQSRRAIASLKSSFKALNNPNLGERRLEDGFRFIVEFERFAGLVYQSRKSRSPAQLGLEEELADAYQQLVSLQAAPVEKGIYAKWIRAYRLAWRKNFALFFITILLFVASFVIGWFCAVYRPEYASLLIGQAMQERVVTSSAWFKDINDNPLFSGFNIAVNNIAVGFKLFLGGCIFGVVGVLLLIYNGIHFGSLFGYCYLYNFDKELLQFVLSHGPLELSIIVACAFGGMLVGQTLLSWPLKDISKRAPEAGSTAMTVLTGILPWLVLAAIFEAFISPSESFTFTFKIISGLLLAIIFWSWTFWPVSDEK